MYKRKIVFLSCLLGLFFSQQNLFGQNEDKPAKVSGLTGFFAAGYQMFDAGDLNAALKDNIPGGEFAFQDDGITMGGGGSLIIRNIMIGGEGHGFFKQRIENTYTYGELSGGWGCFTLGYVLFAKKGFMIYPKTGIGGYNYELLVRNRNLNGMFQNLLSQSGTGSGFRTNGALFSAVLGFSYNFGARENTANGPAIGVELGYTMPLGRRNKWQIWGEEIMEGGPALLVDGFSAKLTIGIGGWNKR